MDKFIFTQEVKRNSDEKKLFNIQHFSELSREGLSFNGVERRLLMREFNSGEKLYIQYPGKESVRNQKPRPWDFRPKLFIGDKWMKDLSFKDVWDDLYNLRDSNIDLSLIATLFFRIAYMLDSELVTRTLEYEDVTPDDNIINRGAIEFSWYEYQPSDEVLAQVGIEPAILRGSHLLPYLSYNDYLAQNEDCKYYYRATHECGEKWKSNMGRRNTLLTHMSVIAFIENLLKFTEITGMFQSGQGVAPLQSKLWGDVTAGRVTK